MKQGGVRDDKRRESSRTGQQSELDSTYKGLLYVFLKSNYESERNALRLVWGAFLPSTHTHTLRGSHTHTQSHRSAQTRCHFASGLDLIAC